MAHYVTSLEHVLAELERVDLYIRLQVVSARHHKQEDERFEGLYISEREIDELTAEPMGLPRWATLPPPWPAPEVQKLFAALAAALEERRAASRAHGVRLRLDELVRLFGLAPIDIDIILIALAPELDLRYEKLYGYLQDDITRRRPSVDLALNLVCPTFEGKLAARERFSATAPLLHHGIITLSDGPSRPSGSMLAKQIKVDDRILGFLLDNDEIEPELSAWAKLIPPPSPGEDLIAPPKVTERIQLAAAKFTASGALLLHLHGPAGVGKKTWARALCHRLGRGLLIVDGARLDKTDEATFSSALRLAAREAALRGSAIYWSGFDALLAQERDARRAALLEGIRAFDNLVFVAGTGAWEPADPRVMHVELPCPAAADRELFFRRALGATHVDDLDTELPVLAGNFRFTGGQIEAAVAVARSMAGRRSEKAELTTRDLYAGCRATSSQGLGTLGKKIQAVRGFSDIVLPDEPFRQLQEICGWARHRPIVYEAWGFGAKLPTGKGLTVLFSGPSGTGKTMAAEIIAGELGLALYKIDLSGLVSKYIGETEKNLSRVFAEAETSNAILFFDEADALFGKRGEVKDAHDRYANIETGYLLQRMEEYEGITILSTNLRRNMDDAFVRRIAFAVVFPFPEEAERLRIWKGVFPKATPVASDVDLAFLAKHFKIAGGNIKNIALGAAFLAASAGRMVLMEDLIRATQRELVKMGKSCVAADFGPYARVFV